MKFVKNTVSNWSELVIEVKISIICIIIAIICTGINIIKELLR